MDFNIDHGFLDGIVRGLKASLLTSSMYLNLIQCENLEDLKLQLTMTEYGPFLQAESRDLTTSILQKKCLESFVKEFRYVHVNSVQPLTQFLDYITYMYMIDNVILLISGTLHHRERQELLEKCHPLGYFEGMAALTTASTPAELYTTILVTTPLAPYFADCISAQDLDEVNIEIIRNSLFKSYLEDFHKFCRTRLNAETFRYMSKILELEADQRCINITLNSIGTELNKQERLALYPKIGILYPEGHQALSQVDETDEVKGILIRYPDYRDCMDLALQQHNDKDKGLDDCFFERQLKEQEIRNIGWIAECIAQKQRDKLSNYIPIF